MGTFKSAIIDSGTSLAYFPSSVVNSIASAIGNCGNYSGYTACKCSGVSSIKSLWVNFNGTAVEMQPEYWV